MDRGLFGYVLRRLAQGVVVLLLVSMITFFLVNIAPGGPKAMMRMETTAEQRAALAEQLDLNEPLHVRYLSWLRDAINGDFGLSLNSREPVRPLILERLQNTALLAFTALGLSILVGIPLGIYSAIRRNSWFDHAATLFSTLGMSIPDFWFGIVLIMFFAVKWRLLPTSGMATIGAPFSLEDRLLHLIMPAVVLMLVILPNIVRFARSSMLEVLGQDFIRTARAKGASPFQVIFRHAVRNALIPVVTMIGLLVPTLLGGSVIAESVFSWPGMGRLAVEASMSRDYTMIMGVTMVAGVLVVVTNLIVDLTYSILDPRIRHE